ncbi:MAG: sugar dehydrogenase complex small subunit [Pseudomonas sp.]
MTTRPTPLAAFPLKRRHLLGATCLGLAALLGGPLLKALAAPPEAQLEVFMQVSRRLSGRDRLDPLIGRRLFEALTQRGTLVEQTLDELAQQAEQRPELWSREQQDLAREILRGWYLGQVDQYDEALVIAYEGALMFSAPPEIQVIRSYCPGRPGFWAERPQLPGGQA